jgi:hypothetical protein
VSLPFPPDIYRLTFMHMPISYTNRRQQTYYVRAVRAKKGGLRYYLTKDFTAYPAEEILEAMPEGYEWYEYPEDGKTALRKIVPSVVPPATLQLIRDLLPQLSQHALLLCHAEPEAVTVYEYPYGPEELGISLAEVWKMAYLSPALRFPLLPDGRYQVQRICQYPGMEGWITMETSPDLTALVQKFAPHIGHESLLDFWIEGEEDF